MTIERQIGHLAERLHHRRADREIGDELSIHDVHVEDTGPTFGRGAYLLTQTGKVRGKNRRCQFNQDEALKTRMLGMVLLPGYVVRF